MASITVVLKFNPPPATLYFPRLRALPHSHGIVPRSSSVAAKSISCELHKDVVGSFKDFGINHVGRVSLHAVSRKAENYFEPDPVKQAFLSTDALALKLEDAVFLEPAPSSSAKKSKKDVPSSAKNLKKEKNPKRLSTSAALIKTTDHFQVIRYPLGTESAIKAITECNTLVFVVDKRADKTNIKDAVKNMFKIRVKKVNTSITPDGIKKAFIMLPPDFKAADVAKRIKIF